MEAVNRMLKGDQVLMAPDHNARAAYEARMVETIAPAEAESAGAARSAAPAGASAPVAAAAEAVALAAAGEAEPV
jgi:hypothetical protein